MSARPVVTVCMPVHRDGALFRTALASVLAQPVADMEVLVSDDSGGTLEAAARAPGDARLRYVANPEPLGFSRNHTACLDRAEGRFVAFLHDDDRWLPGHLPTALGYLSSEPDLGMVVADAWLDWGDGRLRRRSHRARPPAGRHDSWLTLAMRHNVFIPSATVLRREVWEEVRRPFPELVIGDVVLWIDAALAGWPMRWLDEPSVVYRMHSGQVSASQERHRAAGVEIFGGYRFTDRVAEAERRSRTAHYHLGRAGLRLRQGRVADARTDLAAARRLAPSRQRPRRLALRALSAFPRGLPVANRLWARLRRRRSGLDS